MTNLERIKAMTADELAAFLEHITDCSFSTGRGYNEDCANCEYTLTFNCSNPCPCNYPKEWLESEAEK